jgi:hypothetical protein
VRDVRHGMAGPRGNTRKKLERETNCRIWIRGKGAWREEKVSTRAAPTLRPLRHRSLVRPQVIARGLHNDPGADEELHVFLQGIDRCIPTAQQCLQ